MSIAKQTFKLTPDVAIPAVGFGTFLIDPADAERAVRTAIGLGYRHVDTAEVYANEAEVGAGIREALSNGQLTRDDLFVTTKLWPGVAEWGEKAKGKQETLAAFENSLNLLGLDYVDLYLIHSPHGGELRLPQWEALLEIKQSGRARSVGVSNYNQAHIEEIERAGLALPDANQIELHPWSQKPELIGFMREHSIAPIAYSSLAPLSTWRAQPGQHSAKTAETKSDDGVFASLAAKYGVSEAQFLLAWGLANGYAVLPKSLSEDRMRQNLDIGGIAISAEDLEFIRTLDRGPGLAWSVGDPTQLS